METALADVLASKYDIKEPLQAVGHFVALCGVPNTFMLAAVGITDAAFIVTNIALSSDEIDYDVISVTPLPVLTLGVQDEEQKAIYVKGHFKPTQIFQLCSCENIDVVWERFVHVIEKLKDKCDGDGYWRPYLEGQAMMIGIAQHSQTISSFERTSSPIKASPRGHGNNSCISMSYSTRSDSTLNGTALDKGACSSKSLTSLPVVAFPVPGAKFQNRNYNSVECLNIKYESFVNGSREQTGSKCIGSGSDSVTDVDNKSNNFLSEPLKESDVTVTVEDTPADDKSCWIVSVCRRVFRCKTRKTTTRN